MSQTPERELIRTIALNAWWKFIPRTTSTRQNDADRMDALIDGLRAAGYKILPREPTEAMDQSRYDLSSRQNGGSILEYYRAMWDAAP